MISRRRTRAVKVGTLSIGGDAPISVQSMTSTRTEDVEATIAQIKRLEQAGCELVRIAIPTQEAVKAITKIKPRISIPLVADIHFDYRLAIEAIQQGADKIRINPGNIGSKDRLGKILEVAKERHVPIRIGVNAGSLQKSLIQKYNGITPEALVESALEHVRVCESLGFFDLVLSIKASDVPMTIEANRLLAKSCDYPIHLGVTEAGTPKWGALRSAIGIGTLLAEGIGDTIRVSLTGDPVDEIRAGFEILKALHLRKKGITVISCPTCGRLETNMIPIAEAVEQALADVEKPLTIAVMGCGVNGPGEARWADLGVACGKHSALLFRKGQIIKKIREEEIVSTLIEEVKQWEEKESSEED